METLLNQLREHFALISKLDRYPKRTDTCMCRVDFGIAWLTASSVWTLVDAERSTVSRIKVCYGSGCRVTLNETRARTFVSETCRLVLFTPEEGFFSSCSYGVTPPPDRPLRLG